MTKRPDKVVTGTTDAPEGLLLQDAMRLFVKALVDKGELPKGTEIDWGETKPPEEEEQRYVFIHFTNGLEPLKFEWADQEGKFPETH